MGISGLAAYELGMALIWKVDRLHQEKKKDKGKQGDEHLYELWDRVRTRFAKYCKWDKLNLNSIVNLHSTWTQLGLHPFKTFKQWHFDIYQLDFLSRMKILKLWKKTFYFLMKIVFWIINALNITQVPNKKEDSLYNLKERQAQPNQFLLCDPPFQNPCPSHSIFCW